MNYTDMTVVTKKTNDRIRLKNITKKDHLFLYELLKEREPKVNISHRKMPTYHNHVGFILSKPYSRWHIIYYDDQKVGSVYLSKQDEIGLFLKKDFQGKKIGKDVIKILMKNNPRPRYLANIAPKNHRSVRFFEKNGFKKIQCTYEYNISFGK